VFDTPKAFMLGSGVGGGLGMEVDGSWMKLVSFFWGTTSCGQYSQRSAKSYSAMAEICDQCPQG
jgi:hypothetical protein